MIPNLGPCGICSKPIFEFTPVDSVLLGRPQAAYMVHKACKQKSELPSGSVSSQGEWIKASREPEPPGVFTHVLPDPPVEVSWLRSQEEAEQLRRDVQSAVAADVLPSMPHVEQQKRKRGRPRKETS